MIKFKNIVRKALEALNVSEEYNEALKEFDKAIENFKRVSDFEEYNKTEEIKEED